MSALACSQNILLCFVIVLKRNPLPLWRVFCSDNTPPVAQFLLSPALCFWSPAWAVWPGRSRRHTSAHQQQRRCCRQASSPKPLRRSQEGHTHLKINISICRGLSEPDSLLDTRSPQAPAQGRCSSLLGSSLACCHWQKGAALQLPLAAFLDLCVCWGTPCALAAGCGARAAAGSRMQPPSLDP